MNESVFRVGVTRDFLGPDGTCDLDDIAGPLFDEAGLHWEYIAENTPVLQAEQVQDYDALLVLGAGITAETFTDADRLASLLASVSDMIRWTLELAPKTVYC